MIINKKLSDKRKQNLTSNEHYHCKQNIISTPVSIWEISIRGNVSGSRALGIKGVNQAGGEFPLDNCWQILITVARRQAESARFKDWEKPPPKGWDLEPVILESKYVMPRWFSAFVEGFQTCDWNFENSLWHNYRDHSTKKTPPAPPFAYNRTISRFSFQSFSLTNK